MTAIQGRKDDAIDHAVKRQRLAQSLGEDRANSSEVEPSTIQ